MNVIVRILIPLWLASGTVMAQSGGTYDLSWNSLDGGGGTATGGTFTLRSTMGQPDAGAMSGGTYELSGGFNLGDLAACEVMPPLVDPLQKNRVITLTASNAGRPTAIRVTFENLPAPFTQFNGQSMWVGPAAEYCEISGQALPGGQCPPAIGQASDTFFAGRLQCDPHYADWATLGEFHVFSEWVVPGGSYAVAEIDQACSISDEGAYSLPATAMTSQWGDVTGGCQVTPCLPPDGSVDITSDVTAELDKFKNLVTSPSKVRADLEPDVLDMLVNISDVTFALDAFRGDGYPFALASAPCGP